MKSFKPTSLAFALACLLYGAGVAARVQETQAQPPSERDERLALILARAGEGVERYHRGMFRIAFAETHRREELKEDLTPKKSKEYVYESVILRQNFSDDSDDYFARTVSRLKTVDGRPAKKNEVGAAEPVSAHNDFLGFLLPRTQKLYEFTFEGEDTLDGRRALRVGALRTGQGEPRVEWEGGSFVVFAPTKISFWVDTETFDVLRVESHLVREFEFESLHAGGAGPFGRFARPRKISYKREDYAVRFRPVRFKDPEQTLLLPEYAEWVTVIEGAREPAFRTTISFSNYRRFRSDVKVIEDTGPNE